MNRWLARAAGTVGLAGGFLLLGTGTAQADETDTESPHLNGLLADALSPTAGLPPLAVDIDRATDAAVGAPTELIDQLPLVSDLVGTVGNTAAGPGASTVKSTVSNQVGAVGSSIGNQVGATVSGTVGGTGNAVAGTVATTVGGLGSTVGGLGTSVSTGSLAGELPVVGSLIGPIDGALPVVDNAGSAPAVAAPTPDEPPGTATPGTATPGTATPGTATPDEAPGVGVPARDTSGHPPESPASTTVGGRPIAGEDPLFAETTPGAVEAAPAQAGPAETTPSAGGQNAVNRAASAEVRDASPATTDPLTNSPVGTLVGPAVNSLPLLGELAVLDTLAGPVTLVRSLPVVGTVADLLPGA